MDVLWLMLGILSLSVIYLLVYGFNKPDMKKSEKGDKHSGVPTEETERAMDKIMNLFDKKDKIHNDDVEKLLQVSDSTATRYLDRLQEAGKIQQIGSEGRGVYYQEVEK